LNAAGLLWLRERTISHTGCDLAGKLLVNLLNQSPELHAAFRAVISDMASGLPITLFNAKTSRLSKDELGAALRQSNRTAIWMFGASDSEFNTLTESFPDLHIKLLNVSLFAPSVAIEVVLAMILRHVSHYIGSLEERYVKIGLLLRLGTHNDLPVLSTGKSRWNDAYGFASCSAEEFHASWRASQGTANPTMHHTPPWQCETMTACLYHLLGAVAASSEDSNINLLHKSPTKVNSMGCTPSRMQRKVNRHLNDTSTPDGSDAGMRNLHEKYACFFSAASYAWKAHIPASMLEI
jgi:hypothetical protein